MFLGLLGYVLVDRRFRRYQILGRFWRPDWARFREIFRLGLPIGMTLVMEVGLFAAAGFLIGLIGTAELAAHQIALQCAAVTFMVPLGLAQAATVRGRARGRRRRCVGRAARRDHRAGRRRHLHGRDGDRDVDRAWQRSSGCSSMPPIRATRHVLELAVTFLAIAALFQIFDGGQVIGTGALRGIKDTRWPMAIAAVAYWVIGIGLAVGLGFGAGLGALGVWIGLAVALAVAAVLLVGRFFALAGGARLR